MSLRSGIIAASLNRGVAPKRTEEKTESLRTAVLEGDGDGGASETLEAARAERAAGEERRRARTGRPGARKQVVVRRRPRRPGGSVRRGGVPTASTAGAGRGDTSVTQQQGDQATGPRWDPNKVADYMTAKSRVAQAGLGFNNKTGGRWSGPKGRAGLPQSSVGQRAATLRCLTNYTSLTHSCLSLNTKDSDPVMTRKAARELCSALQTLSCGPPGKKKDKDAPGSTTSAHTMVASAEGELENYGGLTLAAFNRQADVLARVQNVFIPHERPAGYTGLPDNIVA